MPSVMYAAVHYTLHLHVVYTLVVLMNVVKLFSQRPGTLLAREIRNVAMHSQCEKNRHEHDMNNHWPLQSDTNRRQRQMQHVHFFKSIHDKLRASGRVLELHHVLQRHGGILVVAAHGSAP